MNLKEKVIDLLKQPKNEQLEYRYPLPPERILAKIISSFANTDGGYLIIGFSKEVGLMGLSADFYSRDIIQKAIKLLAPLPRTKINNIAIEGKNIFVISVDKSNENIFLDDKKYIRQGSETKEGDLNQKSISTKEYEKTYAIIIALEDYAKRVSDQIDSVKYAKQDAELFKNTLINKMNVLEDNITLFINEDAMKSSLEYDLKSLFHILTEKDRLIFYYVGHGFHDGTTNYLSTYDTHPFNVTSTAISLRKLLLDPFLESKCKSALIFIDSCATHIQKENSRSTLPNLDETEFNLQNNDNLYSATFLSCQAGQSSYSCNSLSHGIWTYHLVEAINGHIPSIIRNGKYLTDRSLVDYLADAVHKYAKNNLGYNQNPKAILDADSEFVLAEVKS